MRVPRGRSVFGAARRCPGERLGGFATRTASRTAHRGRPHGVHARCRTGPLRSAFRLSARDRQFIPRPIKGFERQGSFPGSQARDQALGLAISARRRAFNDFRASRSDSLRKRLCVAKADGEPPCMRLHVPIPGYRIHELRAARFSQHFTGNRHRADRGSSTMSNPRQIDIWEPRTLNAFAGARRNRVSRVTL